MVEILSYRKDFNKSIMHSFSIEMLNDGRRQYFNGSMINRIVVDQFQILIMAKINRKTGRKANMINLTLNGCDMINGLYTNIFTLPYVVLTYLTKNMQKLPQKCPFPKVCLN